MGFEIEVKTGDAGTVILRGCSDGTVEFCKRGEITDPKTKEKREGLIAYEFYSNISQAFDRVARMRAASVPATNLKDLVGGIKAIREDIKNEMGVVTK